MGGLGNQMFQYSTAKALALVSKQKLILDVNMLNQDSLRSYDLGIFDNITEEIASETLRNQLFPKRNLLSRKRVKQATIHHYKEQHFNFDQRFLQLSGDNYLEGYFQSEQYFLHEEQKIRHSFNFPALRHHSTINDLKKINSTLSVSVHFRRGDYIQNPKVTNYHGICSDIYYLQSMRCIQKAHPKAHFFIFSDDIEWVKQQSFLKEFDHSLIENLTEKKDWEDMLLMSQCKHNITANSSFSWWGAWLNSYQDKKIISPKNWFNDKAVNTSTLIPTTWVQL